MAITMQFLKIILLSLRQKYIVGDSTVVS